MRPKLDPLVNFISCTIVLRSQQPRLVIATRSYLELPEGPFIASFLAIVLASVSLRISEPTWEDFGTILGASWELFEASIPQLIFD